MNTSREAPLAQKLSGTVERIVFSNKETGYTIAQLIVPGYKQWVTIVGNYLAPFPGERVEVYGKWHRHPTYGKQFQIETLISITPKTTNGIRNYLASGLIKGIGPKMADRIIDHFGEKTLTIIGTRAEQLAEVEGIGPKRIEMIRKSWERHQGTRDAMVFLQEYGITTKTALRILKQYGPTVVEIIRENPYQLAEDISGIGFKTADQLAMKLGFNKKADFRIRAGVIYQLHRLAEDGHVYFPWPRLIERTAEMLDLPPVHVEAALKQIVDDHTIILDSAVTASSNAPAAYLSHFQYSEKRIATNLMALFHGGKFTLAGDIAKVLKQVQKSMSIRLSADQIAAVKMALLRKVAVITGGPGTGKTTIIDVIVRVCTRLGRKVLMAAPTGRAAKRMAEATGQNALTIHRLLEFSYQKGGFQRHENRPLNCHCLIIDEASMIDTILMHQLLKAVPVDASLVMVGDVHQLPSVGAGMVLDDIISSGCFDVVTLKDIFRQSQTSRIIVNAHRINQGKMPDLSATRRKTDFYFRKREEPGEAADFVVNLVVEHIPRVFGFNPIRDIQVLTPMHKGLVGTGNLNRILQDRLNPHGDAVRRGDFRLKTGDKVLQNKNNYDREVFNGDLGIIHHINPETQEVLVSFDDRMVPYTFEDIDELTPAYAISIHKSQGSEYPAVVIPLLTQHYMLLQRNLLYTAVTRGKQLVILVGSKKALGIAVNNATTQKRYTGLKKRLRLLCQ